MRPYIIFWQLLLAGVFFIPTASAQIMVEQGKVVLKVNPGETAVDTLTVHNTSKKDSMILRVYWEDFAYVEPFDGKKEFLAAGTSPRSLSQWINFSPQEFTIEALGTKKITYSVQVPENAKGGYYGVLFIEDAGAKAKDRFGVSIVTRVGSLFFVETTNSTRQGKIANLKYADKLFVGDFMNLGDVTLIPESTYYLIDKEGIVAERGDINKFYLTAGQTASFHVPISEKLPVGDYTAVLTFDFGDGENISAEFDFHKYEDGSISITKSSL